MENIDTDVGAKGLWGSCIGLFAIATNFESHKSSGLSLLNPYFSNVLVSQFFLSEIVLTDYLF